VRSDYFAELFKKTGNSGNSGNSGNQTTEASNDAGLQEADELPKLGNQWVTRVTELEKELEVVTQVTQELPSTGNQAVALETRNNAASSEQLPKLPKLPEKTSDICTHSVLTREDHCKEALPPEAKARRWKVTLTTGQVLLHSSPGGLTRQEAVELSREWGEVAECVPACSGDRGPVQPPSSNAGDHRGGVGRGGGRSSRPLRF
jgi:hypothetical protein